MAFSKINSKLYKTMPFSIYKAFVTSIKFLICLGVLWKLQIEKTRCYNKNIYKLKNPERAIQEEIKELSGK
jgi:hypothetical protein